MPEDPEEKVLIVLAPTDFDDLQFSILSARLAVLGVGYKVAGSGDTIARGVKGMEIPVDLLIRTVVPEQYASLFIIGGPGIKELYDSPELQSLCAAFDRLHKPIAALEYGAPVLATARLLSGRDATCWPAVSNVLQKHGAIYRSGITVETGNILTGIGGSDENDTAFIQEYLRILAGKYSRAGHPIPEPRQDIPIQFVASGKRFVMTHNGRTRTGLIHVPVSYDGKRPFSLVFGLHGQGGKAADFQARGFDALADELDFIMVYPDGYNGDWDILPGRSTSFDDLGFFRVLIGTLEKKYVIDTSRIYMTGHSLGAFMSYRMAYDLSDRLAAIAPSSGLFYLPRVPNRNTEPVSVMHLHALDDRSVPFNGDPVSKDVISAPACVEFWKNIDATDSNGRTFYKNRGIEGTIWTNPENGTDVAFLVFPSGGHMWQQIATERVAGFFYNHPARANTIRIAVDSIAPYNEAGKALTIQTIIRDPSHVTKVTFMKNGEPFGTDTDAPFTLTWTDTTPGMYRLTATAELDTGELVRSTDNERVWVTKPDIGLLKAVSTSSTESASLRGENAVDGDPFTRWASASKDPQWIEIDLGTVKKVSGVTLIWETAHAASYEIRTSADRVNWSSVYSSDFCPGGTEFIRFEPVQARYIQMYGRERATQWGYSLWDFLVH